MSIKSLSFYRFLPRQPNSLPSAKAALIHRKMCLKRQDLDQSQAFYCPPFILTRAKVPK